MFDELICSPGMNMRNFVANVIFWKRHRHVCNVRILIGQLDAHLYLVGVLER